MTAIPLCFGRLYSFAGLDFHSSSSPFSPVRTGWPIQSEGQYDTGLVNTGGLYPYDAQGIEASPLHGDGITLTYEIYLVSSTSSSDGAALKNVRIRYNAILTALHGTYTWGSTTGVSGMKGDLVVYAEDDESGSTLYKATARALRPVPYKLTAGQPGELRIELPLVVLSTFAVVT